MHSLLGVGFNTAAFPTMNGMETMPRTMLQLERQSCRRSLNLARADLGWHCSSTQDYCCEVDVGLLFSSAAASVLPPYLLNDVILSSDRNKELAPSTQPVMAWIALKHLPATVPGLVTVSPWTQHWTGGKGKPYLADLTCSGKESRHTTEDHNVLARY
eukprot:scpid85638/ scgid15891/ 